MAACLGMGCDRSDPVSNAEVEPQWFVEITREAGLEFVHEGGATGEYFLPEIMGPGAALFDYDNDGDLDIYLVNGNRRLPERVLALEPVNRLYRQDPDGRFVDVTDASGLGDGGYGMGVAIGDIDNDGDADVYVTNFGPDQLYRNRGDGTFENITAAASIDVLGWSCSAAFFDYDLDGYLDLYVTQYVEFDARLKCPDHAGRPGYCGPKAFAPTFDVLLRNNGDPAVPGFSDVSDEAGITKVSPGAGLGVVCEDFNLDGWPDVYVANDAYANHLWVNQGNGTFVDDALIVGAAFNVHGLAEAGMGIVTADFDNDNDLDLFLTHLNVESNTFYQNLGGGSGFIDVSAGSGLASSSRLFTGFGVAAFDVEFDGDLDIAVVNGRVVRGDPRPEADAPPPWDTLVEPNLFYLNDGGGRFRLIDQMTASFCRRTELTRGLATGDIDGDGDVDMLINNAVGPARLYRNQAPRQGHWLIVRAFDPGLNRDAIGAQVTVVCGDRRFLRTITRAGSYASSSDPRAHFGLGHATRVDAIEVRWPGGMLERHRIDGVDRVVELARGQGERQS